MLIFALEALRVLHMWRLFYTFVLFVCDFCYFDSVTPKCKNNTMKSEDIRYRKDPVKLRTRELKDGTRSLYLDIYADGRRRYEFLKLYLVPELDPADRRRNDETMRVADAIRAQRVLDMQQRRLNPGADDGRRRLLEYFAELQDRDGLTESTRELWSTVLISLREYIGPGPGPRLNEISADWVRRYVAYLTTCPNRHCARRRRLSANTVRLYLSKLSTCFNEAMRAGIIARNPMLGVRQPAAVDTEREFLTLDELRRLVATPCYDDTLRRAFLFSCLTGLRRSDIAALTFRNLEQSEGRTRIIFRQRKTRGLEYLDVNEQAAELIGAVGAPDDYIFGDFRRYTNLTLMLKPWLLEAGIHKHITFHCGRHTFAVMMIELGVDLFTTSKLLGHRDIKTTQIYARVLDKSKRAAVDRIPELMR